MLWPNYYHLVRNLWTSCCERRKLYKKIINEKDFFFGKIKIFSCETEKNECFVWKINFLVHRFSMKILSLSLTLFRVVFLFSLYIFCWTLFGFHDFHLCKTFHFRCESNLFNCYFVIFSWKFNRFLIHKKSSSH